MGPGSLRDGEGASACPRQGGLNGALGLSVHGRLSQRENGDLALRKQERFVSNVCSDEQLPGTDAGRQAFTETLGRGSVFLLFRASPCPFPGGDLSVCHSLVDSLWQRTGLPDVLILDPQTAQSTAWPRAPLSPVFRTFLWPLESHACGHRRGSDDWGLLFSRLPCRRVGALHHGAPVSAAPPS